MFDKSKYDQQYAKSNIKRLFISLNVNKPEDQEILRWLDQQKNYSTYIKILIRADMAAHEPEQLTTF